MKLLTKERGLAYVQLARIDKPIGTLLLLWPTLWALCLAAGGLPEYAGRCPYARHRAL